MIAQNLECDALLRHRDNCFLIHVSVVDSHAAENRKSLDEVFIVLCKDLIKGRKQQAVKEFFSKEAPLLLTRSSNLLIN